MQSVDAGRSKLARKNGILIRCFAFFGGRQVAGILTPKTSDSSGIFVKFLQLNTGRRRRRGGARHSDFNNIDSNSISISNDNSSSSSSCARSVLTINCRKICKRPDPTTPPVNPLIKLLIWLRIAVILLALRRHIFGDMWFY